MANFTFLYEIQVGLVFLLFGIDQVIPTKNILGTSTNQTEAASKFSVLSPLGQIFVGFLVRNASCIKNVVENVRIAQFLDRMDP